ncbi:hypothetical protein CBR_g45287 [Chara braunii]|uniref:Uncharacterized protein n=1 Tax=Chara braunii TaxID=69332 RepID=A0A388LY25_CHABU|nr:hypothetical protein CBR_g45287 [Chara braunii]|eukprot:GBG87228.1 hypothetical protein CBR_g45287 [Chara braunii]
MPRIHPKRAGNGYTRTKPLRWWFRPTWRGASRDDVVAGKGNESGRWRWEEERRAQNLWCDYNKRVWYLDLASKDGSDPLQPPCGPLLFVAVHADRTRLVGSIAQWVDVGEYNFKFMLKKHYRSDGSVDDIAKGCKVAGRMFGGYDRRAMSLPYFVPLAPGHDEAVHVTNFLEVWARSGTSVSAVDVGPGTSISGPVGFAGGECSQRGMGGQGGLPATPPNQEVGMSDDSEDDHPRAPSKPGLHGSRRQGLLGESTPRGGSNGERLRQGSESTTPHGLVERIGSFVRGMQVAEVSPGDRAGGPQVREVRGSDETTRRARPAPAQLQTEFSQEREASGNVAGEEEVSEQGLFRERSAEKTQSEGKRNLPDEEEQEGVGVMKRQRKVGGSARTPTTREGGSVEKRKRVGGGDETPKDSSTQRRTGESSGKRSKLSRGKKADGGDSGEGDDDVEINLNDFNLDNAFFLEMQTGVQKDVVLHIHPERILAIPDWEDTYNHRSLDEFLVDTIASAMIDCYECKDMRYTKSIFVLAPIVVPPENGEPAVRVLPADFDNSQSEKYWYYPVCGQHNARAAMKVKDHPVFEYYNFCKWPFRPIYFPDDEFDGYAHDEVRKWVQFMALAMKKTQYTPLWNLSTEEKKRKEWAEKLRYYLPLAMADDSVFALGEKFYEEWSKGKLLASDGRRWTEKPPTHEEVAKPGLSTMTDSQGLKKHVWYVKVDDPSLNKGKGKPKKGVEEKTFYVQVPETDVHCWKELVDLTDREKKRLFNDVLNLNFEYEEMDKREWNANSTFFRSKKQLLEEFKDKGLDDKLWNESRKFFTDSTYVNKCPQFPGCEHDNNIKRTATLINDQHFLAEWKRVVLSVITGDCAKGKKNPRGVDECINIMWTRTSALPTLAQFNVDPLSAIDHKEALGKLGHQLRSHTCVLDLCGTVDRAQWDSGAFTSLSELLGFVCQDYWTLVVFVPSLWNLSFMTSLSALGAIRCYTGKWVRKTAAKKTHRFGNNVWEEPDVMHILFKGEDLRLLTHPVYEGAVAEDDAAALRRKQKVAPTDVEEKFFKSLTFADIGNLTQRGALYKDGERNPNQLCNQLLFFCGVADAVLFLGKPHAQYVTHEVSSKAYPCDFHHVVVEPVYDPNNDMFFKLTPKKRRQVYSFLYDEQPRLRFDPQYVVQEEVAIAVLLGYHGASRAGAVSFIKRLEYVFFNEDVVDPADFTLDNYKLTFGEEDDFNIETEQEESVEDDLFDLDGQLAIFNAQVSKSPSVCKPGTPLATPTSGGPTPVSSSAPVKRVAVRDVSGGWIYNDRWDLETFKSRAYDAVLERLSEVNRRSKDDPALREYGDTLFDLLQSSKWLEVSSAFCALLSNPSIKQVSWELPAGTPPAGVVMRKSRGKDGEGDGEGGGQRGTGGGSEQRSTKQRSPWHAGGVEGKNGSREKKKPRSRKKTKHHTGDEQGSDVDRDEDGGVLAVTGSTSMEKGNDFRPGWITRLGEQNSVISSTSATQYTDAVGGAVVAKNGTCFAQLQKWLADCLGSIRTSETTSSSGTKCLPGSETTTYHGSGSDKLQPCSVSPQKEVQINSNREASTVEKAQRSAELKRVVWVSENPGGEIRIHPNQEDVSAMTDDRCQDAVMLCMEVHKELQADCPTEGELATSFNVEPRTLGAKCLVTVRAELAVFSDSPVKADTSSPLETGVARMNPN